MDFFTFANLGTVVGATAIITIILSIVTYLFGSGINERIRNAIVVVAAVVLMVVVSISNGGVWEDYVMAILNGFVISLAVLRLQDETIPKVILLTKNKD